MRAIRIHEHGGPEVLRLDQIEEPARRPGTALVRVQACALNHLDLWVRKGIPGRSISLPRIPGSDIAGKIESVDPDSGFSAGQRVMLSPGVSCGHCQPCLAGEDNRCRGYQLFGSGVDGGCAEKMVAPNANLVPLDDSISLEEAAAFPLVFLTAWHMLVTRARVRPGEVVLVLGANSGVGSAAIQIARLFRCRVIATAGNEAKAAAAVTLGADAVIDHYRESISEEVRKLTDRRGVDVVFEHVGQATWKESLLSAASGGRVVTCGATSGYVAETDLRYLFSKQISLLGSYTGSKAELLEACQFLKQGMLKPIVDRVFPLEQVREAHQYLEEGRQFGKVVLRV
ncbi:MAG: zinc-binding dehydrogenase [Acidobacteria bacterium]|nr:zinc-binding dehydrogenase [Acidobacteriota bacterium]